MFTPLGSLPSTRKENPLTGPNKIIDQRGLILLVALWIVAILSLLAIGLALRMSSEIALVKFYRDNFKAKLAADAAVSLAAKVLSQDLNNYDAFSELWANGLVLGQQRPIFEQVELNQASFSIINAPGLFGLSDEESKINLNSATGHQLEIFLQENKIAPAKEIANSITDWIDSDEITSFSGAESDYYRSLESAYDAKNAPLAVIEELLLIKGMDSEKFDRIKELVTVYGDGKININTVNETVLVSLLVSNGSLDTTARKLAREIVIYRAGPDEKIGTEDDRYFTKFEDLKLALSNPLSIGEFSKCAMQIKFTSQFYRLQIISFSKNQAAKKKTTAILKKDPQAIRFPQVVFLREEN